MKKYFIIFMALSITGFLFTTIAKNYIEYAPLMGWFIGFLSLLIAAGIASEMRNRK